MNRSYGTPKCRKNDASKSRRLGSSCRDGIYSIRKSVNRPTQRAVGSGHIINLKIQISIYHTSNNPGWFPVIFLPPVGVTM